ncbi:hypothetical protein [Peribacillus butanolivorans]
MKLLLKGKVEKEHVYRQINAIKDSLSEGQTNDTLRAKHTNVE